MSLPFSFKEAKQVKFFPFKKFYSLRVLILSSLSPCPSFKKNLSLSPLKALKDLCPVMPALALKDPLSLKLVGFVSLTTYLNKTSG